MRVVSASLLLALALLPRVAVAEDPPARIPDPVLAEAARARAEGRYTDAEARYRKALESPDAGPEAAAGLARVLAETGRTAEAVEAARLAAKAAPADTGTLVLLGTLEASAGDLEGAERNLRAAVEGSASSVEARVALGELLRDTGRRRSALEVLLAANDLWAQGGGSEDPGDLLALARGRFAIMEMDPGYRDQKNSTFRLLAGPLEQKVPEAFVLQGEFYTRDDQNGKVPNALRPLLDRNPNHPGALVVAARAKTDRFESDEAAALARGALAVDPAHPGAIEILALQLHGDGDRKGAEELVRRGLAAHPRDRVLLALDAIPLYLDGKGEEYEAAARRVLAVDPSCGRAFLLLARVLEDGRRFAEAAEMSRRAVKTDPLLAAGWFSLARNLLNLGEEKPAREALDRSEKSDPWGNRYRDNFRDVLDEIADYAAGATKHFDLRIHRSEDAVLRGLYGAALEESFESLRERYGYDPETPVLVEVFRRADEFSVRTLGVPGFGAIGACFGKVVTLDSPGALPAGAFCWRSTQHHELAHVFHLQMTKGRVPRWFTEGLAVHEETRANPAWVRNMDRDLVSALANGEVRGLLKINAAFRGPTILWAYYQGGLMCGWLEREFGWPKVREMLLLYGEGLDDAGAARRALGLSPEEFDARFLEECRRRTAGWQVRPAWSDARLKEFRRRSDADPKDLEAHLLYGEACLQRGNRIDAGTALARARGLAPEDPFLTELRALLLLRSAKAPAQGVALLREAVAKGRDHFDLRLALAREAEDRGLPEEALEHYRRAKVQFPRAQGDADPRRAIARILVGLGRQDEAVREIEERVSLSETELEGRLELAGIREGRGDAEGAARILREVLDICPVPGPAPPRGKPPFPAAEVHARLGRALVSLRRPGEAADSFRRAAAVARDLEPKAPPADVAGLLVEQARAARDAGRLLEARAAAGEAMRLDPGNTDAAELLRSVER